jgi:hypothetical protein
MELLKFYDDEHTGFAVGCPINPSLRYEIKRLPAGVWHKLDAKREYPSEQRGSCECVVCVNTSSDKPVATMSCLTWATLKNDAKPERTRSNGIKNRQWHKRVS